MACEAQDVFLLAARDACPSASPYTHRRHVHIIFRKQLRQANRRHFLRTEMRLRVVSVFLTAVFVKYECTSNTELTKNQDQDGTS